MRNPVLRTAVHRSLHKYKYHFESGISLLLSLPRVSTTSLQILSFPVNPTSVKNQSSVVLVENKKETRTGVPEI